MSTLQKPSRIQGSSQQFGPLVAHVTEWERLAREATTLDGALLAKRIHDGIRQVPNDLSAEDALAVRVVIGEVLVALIRRTNSVGDGNCANAFLALVASYRTPEWTLRALEISSYCLRASAEANSWLSPVVSNALRLIQNCYSDNSLDQPALASRLGISVSHLTRQLRRQTGQTFLQHLHRRRAEEARRMLVGSAMPLKAVAHSVGYASTAQLRRHFFRRFGIGPNDARSGGVVNKPGGASLDHVDVDAHV